MISILITLHTSCQRSTQKAIAIAKRKRHKGYRILILRFSLSHSTITEKQGRTHSQVADEFIKRRRDTEWFLEDDFDTYVGQMRQPHVWGGEPELLMSSHVLKIPITVYMRDRNSGSLKVIAEYGQEYGKENPICVLYHGYGHYDALQNQTTDIKSKQGRKR
ncbi:OVARIAN TUMOR DOMAIN-containing deubiquitinating enzyme 4 isoform X2 [Ricinus communis]|uniref:OVARIAN TUMOR DOMAIN-containing deubiquitinating enzyme 4 isoform X2 n=1 Tax=Ricinus communis TaxID=3988 RepID=UPI00201A65F1|nr:OVARIAN TUMOR DOMAIN-containing deubiquitinating enzyme 4 isoform X2 [Ricinus communis]